MSPRNFKLIFLIYFLIQFVCPSSVNSQSQGGLNVGEKCPEIILKNIINHTSSKAKLSDFKGKKIILDFWATWCNPCLKNLPKMEALQKKYQSEIKVFLIGEDSKKNIERFL
ncbi:MAG: redoxin domain-containing protein [Bacteroidota bacterium]